MNKAEKQHAKIIRKQFAYLNDQASIDATVQQSLGHRKEKLVRDARLKEIERLNTWENDNTPHHPWSNRCLGCGRWNIAEDENGMYGPTWLCPANCGGWDLWLNTQKFLEQE